MWSCELILVWAVVRGEGERHYLVPGQSLQHTKELLPLLLRRGKKPW